MNCCWALLALNLFITNVLCSVCLLAWQSNLSSFILPFVVENPKPFCSIIKARRTLKNLTAKEFFMLRLWALINILVNLLWSNVVPYFPSSYKETHLQCKQNSSRVLKKKSCWITQQHNVFLIELFCNVKDSSIFLWIFQLNKALLLSSIFLSSSRGWIFLCSFENSSVY